MSGTLMAVLSLVGVLWPGSRVPCSRRHFSCLLCAVVEGAVPGSDPSVLGVGALSNCIIFSDIIP